VPFAGDSAADEQFPEQCESKAQFEPHRQTSHAHRVIGIPLSAASGTIAQTRPVANERFIERISDLPTMRCTKRWLCLDGVKSTRFAHFFNMAAAQRATAIRLYRQDLTAESSL